MKIFSDCPALDFTWTAGSTDTGYAAANVGDDFPKNRWQGATAADDYLKTDVSAGQTVNAVFIGGTNAAAVTVTKRDVSTGTTVYTTATPTVIGGNAWADITVEAGYQLRVAFTPPAGEKPYCGIIRAGDIETFADLEQSFSQDAKDFSIVHEVNSGDIYVNKKDVVRQYSAEVITDTDTATAACPLMELARTVGQTPVPVLLLSSGFTLPLFARFEGMPSSGFLVPGKNRAGFGVVEVV